MRALFIFGIGLGILMGSSAFGRTLKTPKCSHGAKQIMCPTDIIKDIKCQLFVNKRYHNKPARSCREECHPDPPEKNADGQMVCGYQIGLCRDSADQIMCPTDKLPKNAVCEVYPEKNKPFKCCPDWCHASKPKKDRISGKINCEFTCFQMAPL
jgi:hypothetical protein